MDSVAWEDREIIFRLNKLTYVPVTRINGLWSVRRQINNCSSQYWYSKSIVFFGAFHSHFYFVSTNGPEQTSRFILFSTRHTQSKSYCISFIQPALGKVLVVVFFLLFFDFSVQAKSSEDPVLAGTAFCLFLKKRTQSMGFLSSCCHYRYRACYWQNCCQDFTEILQEDFYSVSCIISF